MIYCLLVQITRNSRGQAIREEREIAGDSLRIGRGANCILHLPDPRINLQHATIQYSDDGNLYLESISDLLNFNGEQKKREALRAGSHITVGPYVLIVEEKDNDHDLVLSYELVQPLSDDRAEFKRRSRTSLSQTRISKRTLALVLASIIAVAFLALPVFNAIKPSLHASSKNLPITLDESWNPGPISNGHQAFAKDCQQCHRKPFVQVEDLACTSCHKDIAGHIADKTLQAGMFGVTRCANCHLEHKNNNAMIHGSPKLCVACHSNLKNHESGNSTIALNNISDFSTDHPGFNLSIKTGVAAHDINRIAQSDKKLLLENSGLKFPHDVHLSGKGIKSPDGRVVMQCNNCHIPDEAGVRFKPITMQGQCANCHRLEFEPAVTSRQVPHGNLDAVMTTLREFYATQSIGNSSVDVATVDGLLRRPEQTEAKTEQLRASVWANKKANAIAQDLIEVRVCSTCHTVTRNSQNIDQPWSIAPVVITDNWLPKSNFSHNQHANEPCATCHNVVNSKLSSDIAIPDINKCQSCHAGAMPARNKVTSTCVLCHAFHLSSHPNLPTEHLNTTQADAKAKETP